MDPPSPSALEALTQRETEVLRLIARGLSSAEISDTLVIAMQTTKTYVGRILSKLDLRSCPGHRVCLLIRARCARRKRS